MLARVCLLTAILFARGFAFSILANMPHGIDASKHAVLGQSSGVNCIFIGTHGIPHEIKTGLD